jgi:hypothetical protein
VVKFLIDHNIDVSAKAFDGSTAADLARKHGHAEIVQILEGIQQSYSDSQANFGGPSPKQTQCNLRFTGMLVTSINLTHEADSCIVIAADGLYKRDLFCK